MSITRNVNRKLKRTLQSKVLSEFKKALANNDLKTLESLSEKLEKALGKKYNLLLCSDGYKYSHPDFYPDKLEKVISYLESRGGKFEKTVFIGIQRMLIEHLEGLAITKEDVDEAYEYLGTELGSFGREGVFKRERFDYIVEEHNGRLPIEIKAVPEGTVLSTKNVLLTIENTDPKCAWLTNFLETLLLQLWYPITVATLSREVKKLSTKYFRKNTDLPIETQDFLLQYVLNDFGFRGVSSTESAEIGGLAHLAIHDGGDTTLASRSIFNHYDSDIVNATVPATEHSIMTILGREGECEMIRRTLLAQPTGIVACVMDSFNIFTAIPNYLGKELKELILSRPSEPGNQLVVRPDCYSEDTLIFTDSGWKLFSELDIDKDLVAQVLDDGSQEFVKATNYISKVYSGDMISFKDYHGKVDLLVTPNHRMTYTHNGVNKVEEAKDVKFYSSKKIYRSAKTKDLGLSLSPLEALKVAFQADGSYATSGNNITFTFSKERKKNRLINILDNLNLEYEIYDLKDGRCEFNISVDSTEYLKDLSWVDTKNLCSNWAKEFIEELSCWDSTRRSETRFKFDTTIKNVSDVVELVALSAGYGVLTKKHVDDRKEMVNDVYTSHILKENKIDGGSIEKKLVKGYNGKVYCVSVPSGKLLVKRNLGQVVCGNCGHPVRTLEEVFKLLFESFGYETNTKGYKILPPQIRVIQGDGVNLESINEIYEMLDRLKISPENLVFGMGGKLLQAGIHRDLQNFATKACHAVIDGKDHSVIKSPVEMDKDGNIAQSFKKSKEGRPKLVLIDGGYNTLVPKDYNYNDFKDELITIFKNGEILNRITFEEIRKNAKLAEEEINEL